MAGTNQVTSEQIGQVVEGWFADHFRNNVLSRDTDVYNAAVMAKADLKERLGQLVVAEQEIEALTTGDEHQ